MSKLEEKATDAWAVYEYREHPKGLYYTCFVDGYQQGYEQAEKDLALTLEDMATIDSLITEVSNSYAVGNYDHDGEREHFYGEVLKRFKETKDGRVHQATEE